MKPLLTLFVVCCCLNAAAQFTLNDFKKLYQLNAAQGWEMKHKKGSMIEQWTMVNDSLLTGNNYLILTSTGDTMTQETIELKFSGGVITYTPVVTGQNEGRPVSFTLAAITGTSFAFENKAHDFPQRIVYQLGGKTLQVTISSMSDAEGPLKKFDFVMR